MDGGKNIFVYRERYWSKLNVLVLIILVKKMRFIVEEVDYDGYFGKRFEENRVFEYGRVEWESD